MRIIFFGTPAIAVPFIEGLIADHEVAGVVSQPDRPSKRGQKLRHTPVKEIALKHNIPVFQPEKFTTEIVAQLKELKADIGVVVSYGKLIPRDVFEAPAFGCFNVHFSLLPKYRGASPVQRAIVNGEKETGVTTFRLEKTLDTGPVFTQICIPITDLDDSETLFEKLTPIGIKAVDNTLALLSSGKTAGTPQTGEPSYAPCIKKEDGKILWDRSAKEIFDLVRGLKLWPGAYTSIGSGQMQGKMLKLLKTTTVPQIGAVRPAGKIVELVKQKGFIVQCGQGCLLIEQVHVENKNPSDAWSFIQGSHLQVDCILR